MRKGFSFQVPLQFNISKYNLELDTHKCFLCTIQTIEKPQILSQKTNRYCHVIFLLNCLFVYCVVLWCNMIVFGYTHNANNCHIIFLCQIELVWWVAAKAVYQNERRRPIFTEEKRDGNSPSIFYWKSWSSGKKWTHHHQEEKVVGGNFLCDWL